MKIQKQKHRSATDKDREESCENYGVSCIYYDFSGKKFSDAFWHDIASKMQ